MSVAPHSTNATGAIGVVARGLLLVGASVVAALFCAEIVLRLLRLSPAEGVGTVSARQYEEVPGIFAPNQRVIDIQKPALPYSVRIDSLGFRGVDFPRRKPPGQFRVVMIGDSFVYGDFVDDSVTFPVQLEQRLRRACPDARVINAGLGGTTIVDEAFMMQRTLSLDPDLVILVYTESDIEDLASPQTAWQALAANRLRKSRFPLSVLYPLFRNTALWNLGLKVVATKRVQRDIATRHQAAARDGVGMIDTLRERYGAALVSFRDTLTSHGVRFVFAMFPSWLELQSQSADLTWVARFASAHAINGVNLLPALQAAHLPAARLYLIPRDGHPSPSGYSIAADDLAENLVRGPVAAACGH